MFPETDYNFDMDTEINDPYEEDTESVTIGRTPKYDFDNNCYCIEDGKVIECTQQESIEQWIAFLVKTKLNKFPVYDDTGFGSEVETYIGYKRNNLGFVISEIKREITEKAELNRTIDYIDNFDYTKDADSLHITLDVHLIDSTTVEVNLDV